jgi:hypothetical protein
MKLRFSRRVGLISFAVVALAALAAGATLAAFPDTDVSTFTGCLNSGGQIGDVATGLAPRKACSAGEQTIHLGGGDITKVSAGAGLTGGGDNGAVSLGLDPGSQLPQGCSDGQTPEQNGGVWTCASTDPTVWTSTGDMNIGPDDFKTVASLSLPAGTFVVLVTGGVNNNDTGNVEASCSVTENAFPSIGGFEVQTELTDVRHAVIPVAASGIATETDPLKVNVSCQMLGSNDDRDLVHYSLRLIAFRAGTIVSQ